MLRIAPPAFARGDDVLPKDVAFVLDTSGSMAGEKMEQAISALKFCLANLNKEDRFNIVPFSHEPLAFRTGLVDVTTENVAAASEFAGALKANGGTNINDALLKAIREAPAGDANRPYLIVFLTDGQPHDWRDPAGRNPLEHQGRQHRPHPAVRLRRGRRREHDPPGHAG